MSELNLKQLAKVFSQINDCSIQQGNIQLTIEDATLEQLQDIQNIIEQCKQLDTIDYSKYFAEVESCTFYKPGNPILALTTVAKKHKLKVDEFKTAFKNRA